MFVWSNLVRVSATMCFSLGVACMSPPSKTKSASKQPFQSEEGYVALTTVAPDYSVGALAAVSLDDYQVTEQLAAVSGDPVVVYDAGVVWQLNRYMFDTIRKYDPNNLTVPTAEVSVSPEVGASNPHDVAVCGGELYVSQFDQPAILVLDLDTLQVVETIDISSYAADGNPEASTMLVWEDSVLVGLQNFDRSSSPWSALTGQILQLDCSSRRVVQDWSFGANIRLVTGSSTAEVLVSTSTTSDTVGGVYTFEPQSGHFELLASGSYGDVSSMAGFDDWLMTIELASDYSGYQVACHDRTSGESIQLETQAEHLTDIAIDKTGVAWVLSNFGWVDPANDFVGIRLYDVESCSELPSSPLSFEMGPFSIAIVE